jgi:regulatory protein
VAFAARSSSGSSSTGRGTGGRSGGARQRPSEDERPPPSPADPVDVARQICLHQLEFAPRTRAELAAVLRKKGVEDDVAEEVLGRFTEVGMIDDAVFAQMWVTSRHRGRGLAGRALQQELRRKGVDDDDIAEAVATLDPEQEAATARALVDRKLRSTRGLAHGRPGPPARRDARPQGLPRRRGVPHRREALAEEGEEAELAFDELQALDDEP